MAVAMFLFLATDSYIALKTSFLYFIGLYAVVILKLCHESPRPYWIDERIDVF